MTLTARLHEIAGSAGSAGSGVGTTGPFLEGGDSLRSRVADGSSAGMALTFRSPEIATGITKSFPWGTHLFVVAIRLPLCDHEPGVE